MRSRFAPWLFVLVALGVSAARAQNAGAQAPATQPGAAQPAPSDTQGQAPAAGPDQQEAMLGGGDLLDVEIYGVPDLTSKGRISNDGDFYMPLIGYVRIGGLSTEDAQALIEKKYVDGGFLKNPHVTINVTEYVTDGASLLGEVSKPGIYPVLGQRRLFDIISAAGGFTPAAGRTVTITHRSTPDKPTIVTFSNSPDKATEANVQVFPGDTILVARAPSVYVVGEVGHPNEILMQNQGLTVLKALAISGGPTHSAKLDSAKIIRRTNGNTEEIALPLKQIMTAKAKDVAMMPEDILFVPGKNVTAIQTILGLATGLAMRVPF